MPFLLGEVGSWVNVSMVLPEIEFYPDIGKYCYILALGLVNIPQVVRKLQDHIGMSVEVPELLFFQPIYRVYLLFRTRMLIPYQEGTVSLF